MIQVGERQFKVIFCFLTKSKCDLFPVNKETVQVVEWHFKFLFYLLTSSKFVLNFVYKTIF